MSVIDLRSDTVTHPSPEMRDAIYDADIGDDVFSDDPSVNKLEAKSADIMGKEAAVFVASGTMGNLISLNCNRCSKQSCKMQKSQIKMFTPL